MKQKQLSKVIFLIGGTITIFGALTQLFEQSYAPFLFSLGALVLIYFQFQHAWDSNNAELRIQRLGRIGFLSSLLLALAAYFMFTNSDLWVVAVLIYALISFFLSFRGN